MPRNPLSLPWRLANFAPDQNYILSIRYHPSVLLGPVLLVVGGLAAAIISTVTRLPRNWPSPEFIWVAWIALLACLIWKVLQWSSRYFVITTSYQLFLHSGLVRHKVVEKSLTKIVRIRLYRSILGTLFRYGELRFESVSMDQQFWSLYNVPYPEQLFLEFHFWIVGDIYDEPTYHRRKIISEIGP